MFSIVKRYLPFIVVSTVAYLGVFFLGIYTFNINQASANLISFLLVSSISFFLDDKMNLNLESVRLPRVAITLFMIAISLVFGKIADHHYSNPTHTALFFSIAVAIYSGISKRIYFNKS